MRAFKILLSITAISTMVLMLFVITVSPVSVRASSSFPVINSFNGPDSIMYNGGPYTFSVAVSGGTPPYTYTWGSRLTTLSQGQGDKYSSLTISGNQLSYEASANGVWVDVKDSKGTMATWLDDAGQAHTDFFYGYGLNSGESPSTPPHLVLQPTYPYKMPGGNSKPAPTAVPSGTSVPSSTNTSGPSDSSSTGIPSWAPIAIGAIAVVAIGVLGVLGISKVLGPRGPSSGTAPAEDSSSPDASTDDGSDSQEDNKDKKGPAVLRLTYPAGRSPKVFTRGWLFGAECIDENGNDVSDLVEWSGSGSFEPATGRQSRPVFDSEGPNQITLSCTVGDKKLKQTFPVMAVSPVLYARVGSIAVCPSDSHGGGGSGDIISGKDISGRGGSSGSCCPHHVVGRVIAGSPTVFIDGLPAARVGDPGTHAACCGPNTFKIAEGDPEVLIDGKPAARFGDRTEHCGGMGKITSTT